MQRAAGIPQGVLLISMAWLAPIGSTLFAPVLPQIIQHFSSVANASLLAPIALVTPALFVALLAPLAGILADRIGRKTLLFYSMLFYAIAGVMPAWLDSLYTIIASRVVVGIAEAGVMTAGTALICDYFAGERRAHWLSLQFGSASFVATVCFVLAGFLGGYGWRVPFLVYGATALFIPLILMVLFEPSRTTTSNRPADMPADTQEAEGRLFNTRFIVCLVLTMICGMLFYVMPVHVSLLLAERGIVEPSVLGLASAAGSFGVVAGTLLFRSQARRSIGVLLSAAMMLQGIGFILLYTQASLVGGIVGMFINNIGCGISLPLVLAFTMARLPDAYRGRASGIWTSMFFIGQFICPLVVGAVSAASGGMIGAMAGFAAFTLLGAGVFAIWSIFGMALKEPVTIKRELVGLH
ncbi:MFS transporter [Agrobacterium vitis]|nr:MFS transporter [Agrobacterium vitis]MCF1452847.1 MFS transporter [Agrobacterium vitis]BCH56592.1 MFS transporter [Agrobacterium vitis]